MMFGWWGVKLIVSSRISDNKKGVKFAWEYVFYIYIPIRNIWWELTSQLFFSRIQLIQIQYNSRKERARQKCMILSKADQIQKFQTTELQNTTAPFRVPLDPHGFDIESIPFSSLYNLTGTSLFELFLLFSTPFFSLFTLSVRSRVASSLSVCYFRLSVFPRLSVCPKSMLMPCRDLSHFRAHDEWVFCLLSL